MIKEGSLCLAIIPIDIEQWRTGIEILNGCCQYSTARFELSIYNIFSMNVMFVYVSINPSLYLKFQNYFPFFTSFFFTQLLFWNCYYAKPFHYIESLSIFINKFHIHVCYIL